MKIKIKLFGVFLCLLIGHLAIAQESRSSFKPFTIEGTATATFEQPITALMIEATDEYNFEHFQYFYQGSWHHLEHGHNLEHPFRSDPIILANDENALLLKSQNQQSVILHTVFCPPYNANIKLHKKNNVPCSKPNTISPSSWRAGMAEPKPGRMSTNVAHCVIHHSAGSNFNSDYYNVVRNIYLLHTQTNGWDDIGYNYLIAQDGSLFIGRDPQGVNSEDNIQGAHFCSKNAFTMGTCLLGTYSDTLPTDTTWAILKQLLVWKLMKEKRNPQDSSLHPDATGKMLPTIAGHRDGCNTECPGQKVYEKLPQLRTDVKVAIENCNLTSVGSIDNKINLYVMNGYLHVDIEAPQFHSVNYRITNMNGMVISKGIVEGNKITIDPFPSGLYYLVLNVGNNQFTTKFPLLR